LHRRIQETKQFMMNLTDNQLELTTKRTIMENEQMIAEVAYQSRQTSALVGQNLVLDARVAELRQALALSRDTQEELAKRNTIYQSTIKQLVRFVLPGLVIFQMHSVAGLFIEPRVSGGVFGGGTSESFGLLLPQMIDPSGSVIRTTAVFEHVVAY
jgi:hypothetical protein